MQLCLVSCSVRHAAHTCRGPLPRLGLLLNTTHAAVPSLAWARCPAGRGGAARRGRRRRGLQERPPGGGVCLQRLARSGGEGGAAGGARVLRAALPGRPGAGCEACQLLLAAGSLESVLVRRVAGVILCGDMHLASGCTCGRRALRVRHTVLCWGPACARVFAALAGAFRSSALSRQRLRTISLPLPCLLFKLRMLEWPRRVTLPPCPGTTLATPARDSAPGLPQHDQPALCTARHSRPP